MPTSLQQLQGLRNMRAKDLKFQITESLDMNSLGKHDKM